MSMLAEPRRKQKWSVDPRNSAWSKDESKFGQKMLERMGWSKGKGLGKSEQGATEHIKVKVKNNSLGLGTTVHNEDNWIAHQDDFNQLLAELNNCHGQSTEEPTQEETQGFSLEEKSKTSKKRVHYMKFTKGKDLSNRSETDLACIFGKRLKQANDQDESRNGRNSQEEEEEEEEDGGDQDGPPQPEVELHTVTSPLTMQEYFAQRMAQLKKGCGQSPSPGATPTPTDPSPDPCDMEESLEKKKKKRRKKKKEDHETAGGEDEEQVEEAEEPLVTEAIDDEEQGDLERRKKKKKKKKNKGEAESGLAIAGEDPAKDVEAVSPDKRKSKRKDKGPRRHTPPESANEHAAAGMAKDGERLGKRRKKRKGEQVEEVTVEETKKIVKKKRDH